MLVIFAWFFEERPLSIAVGYGGSYLFSKLAITSSIKRQLSPACVMRDILDGAITPAVLMSIANLFMSPSVLRIWVSGTIMMLRYFDRHLPLCRVISQLLTIFLCFERSWFTIVIMTTAEAINPTVGKRARDLDVAIHDSDIKMPPDG